MRGCGCRATSGPGGERRIRDEQFRHRLTTDQVLDDDAFQVRRRAVAIPGAFRVDHHDRPARAHAQAVRLGAQQAADHPLRAELPEPCLQVIPARELVLGRRALATDAQEYVAGVASQLELRDCCGEWLVHAGDSATRKDRPHPGTAPTGDAGGNGVSERLVVGLARADPDRTLQVRNEDLAVPDLAGARGADDGFDHLLYQRVLYRDLDAGLRHEVHHVLRPAIELRVAALTTEALYFGDGHPGDANLRQGGADVVQLEGLDDCADQLHGALAPRVLRPPRLAGTPKSICRKRAGSFASVVPRNPTAPAPAWGVPRSAMPAAGARGPLSFEPGDHDRRHQHDHDDGKDIHQQAGPHHVAQSHPPGPVND